MTYEQFKVEQEQSRLYKTISFQNDFISKSKVKRRTAKKWSHRQINEYKKNICRLGKKHSPECITNYFGKNVYLNQVDYILDDGNIKSIRFFTAKPKTRWCTKLTINEARKIVPRLNK